MPSPRTAGHSALPAPDDQDQSGKLGKLFPGQTPRREITKEYKPGLFATANVNHRGTEYTESIQREDRIGELHDADKPCCNQTPLTPYADWFSLCSLCLCGKLSGVRLSSSLAFSFIIHPSAFIISPRLSTSRQHFPRNRA